MPVRSSRCPSVASFVVRFVLAVHALGKQKAPFVPGRTAPSYHPGFARPRRASFASLTGRAIRLAGDLPDVRTAARFQPVARLLYRAPSGLLPVAAGTAHSTDA